MGLKTKQLLKESVDYLDVTIVNTNMDLTPYIVNIGGFKTIFHYLCFAETQWDALSDVMNYIYDNNDVVDTNGNCVVLTKDEVMDWMIKNAMDYEYDELKEQLAEIEDKLDIVDMEWDEYRELDREKDRIESEIESLEEECDESIYDYFESDEMGELYIGKEDFDVEEISMEEAKEIISEQE